MALTKAERAARKAELAASVARIQAAQAEALTALRNNCCPACGRKVVVNYSIAGWVQCSQFGAVQFRADKEAPACRWQGFTR